VLAFFRYYMRDGHETEVMVYVYWDKEDQGYRISVPMQKVGKAHISVVIPPDETIDAERYVHVADIHSHNSMPAFFSGTDDRDELATRVYIVVGCLNQIAPSISARISVGGRFVPIDARQAVDIPSMIITSSIMDMDHNPEKMDQRFEFSDCPDFPQEWISMVQEDNRSVLMPTEVREPQCRVNKSLWAQCLYRLRGRIGYRIEVQDYEI